MRRTFVYIRATSDDEVEAQREAILAFFERDGRDHREANWYDETGRSARLQSFHERLSGSSILDRCRAGDELVIHTFDRLTRSISELVKTLLVFADQRLVLVVVGTEENAASFDLDAPTLELFRRALLAIGGK